MASRRGVKNLFIYAQQLRGLSKLVDTLAPIVAADIKRDLDAGVARGVSPDGTKLKPTASGKVPLRNAAKAITVEAVGRYINTRVTGVDSRHNLGAVKGGNSGSLKRPIIPSRGIPPRIEAVIKAAHDQVFRKIMGTP